MSEGGTHQGQIDYLNKEIARELSRWQLHALPDPKTIGMDQFLHSVNLGAVQTLLIEKGVITQEELVLQGKKQLLSMLKNFGDHFIKEMSKVATPERVLHGPNGEVIRIPPSVGGDM